MCPAASGRNHKAAAALAVLPEQAAVHLALAVALVVPVVAVVVHGSVVAASAQVAAWAAAGASPYTTPTAFRTKS